MNEENMKQLEHEAFESFKDHLKALGYKVELSEDEAIEAVKRAIPKLENNPMEENVK
jgi:isoaspartyl peptidase/L-asparaginase-like protein (Ntn-hydrolase superfamily)